jgi:AcrR family transcriptional regulator
MNFSSGPTKPRTVQRRRYQMRDRAQAMAETRERILRAVLELHLELFHDQITLDVVADRAAVTVQTILRHFGSREVLVREAADQDRDEVWQQRSAAPVGDVRGAVANLVEHYEEWGQAGLRLLAQEERVAELKSVADRARQVHYRWVDQVFAPWLTGDDGGQLRAKLITLGDLYVWKLLRLDLGFDRAETEELIAEMVEAVLTRRRG